MIIAGESSIQCPILWLVKKILFKFFNFKNY